MAQFGASPFRSRHGACALCQVRGHHLSLWQLSQDIPFIGCQSWRKETADRSLQQAAGMHRPRSSHHAPLLSTVPVNVNRTSPTIAKAPW